MKKIKVHTTVRKMLADVYTPVGIYLRLRNRFRDTILLESTDHHAAENSYSFICINAIAGIEIRDQNRMEYKLPGLNPESIKLSQEDLSVLLWDFMSKFEMHCDEPASAQFAQGLYGYFSFDIVPLIQKIDCKTPDEESVIPLARYRLYQYVIAINHYKDELILCENMVNGVPGETDYLESLINNKDVPVYPFSTRDEELSNMPDKDFLKLVEKGIEGCYRGDFFQIVLSRRYQQSFSGDDFNVYRTLRNINPSPYLFYFDYGDYKLMGSSPEAQLVIKKQQAIVHPIAGTFLRTGDDETDQKKAEALQKDPKENAEHVMLVDLARNDLSTVCSRVEVSRYKQVQFYSHVIHLVSEVKGQLETGSNPFEVLFKTFPAGTLSGAPKFSALKKIFEWEPTSRSFYGGAIGFVGFNGDCNHAIMIRTLLSRDNTFYLQAGAGVVAASNPELELQEVNNKLNALKQAIQKATAIK